jgi:hypothetical protein
VSLQTALQYFSYFGAVIAIVLGILKIREYFKDRPILLIRQSGNCFFDYGKNEKTYFDASIEVTNVGRRTTTIKKILVDILDAKEKQLNIHSWLFEVQEILESGACLDTPLHITVNKKMPKKTYFLRAKVVTTHKEYTRIISVPHFDEFVEPIYQEIEDGKKKGLIE